MTGSMTLERVAARAAKRKNNRTARALPLLAATGAIPANMLTEPARERARIEHQRERAQKWLEEHRKKDQERALLAERYKSKCRELVDDETAFATLLRGAEYTERLEPVYALDYWHQKLARLDARYCPHAPEKHRGFAGRRCPVCLQEIA